MTEQEQLEREKYFEDKNKFAYSLYKQGKFFRKARAIIKDGDDFLVLHSPEKNIYAIAGGGIENHESAKNGCIREVFEEMGLKIKVEKTLKWKLGVRLYIQVSVSFIVFCKSLQVIVSDYSFLQLFVIYCIFLNNA